jgi:peptidyl-prolyl cis-trans isomerase SurA
MTRPPARRRRLSALAALAALVLVLAPAQSRPASAQGRQAQRPQGGEVLRIAAVVNDDVVSVLELQARVRLTLVTSGLPPTQETAQRLQPQMLRNLIDEHLQVQEATRLGITVADAEVDAAMRRIEQANHMPANALPEILRRTGVPISTLASQIRASIAWQRVLQQRLAPTIQVTDDDVREVQERLQASRGNVENLLSEIFLPVDSPEADDEVKNTALSLIEQMHRGTSFPAVALQFSQSTSAANGGDIGWVEQGTLDDPAEAAIRAANPPAVTAPIRSIGGYYIYGVRQRRTIAVANPDDITVEVAQLRLPIERGPRGADQAALLDLAEQVRTSVSGCDDLRRVAGELHVPPLADPQRGRLGQLPVQYRQILQGLRVGEASRPLTLPQGLIILMICSRDDNPNMPNRDQITETLIRTRVDAQSRRMLRDLRRAAFIDIRV